MWHVLRTATLPIKGLCRLWGCFHNASLTIISARHAVRFEIYVPVNTYGHEKYAYLLDAFADLKARGCA